MSTFGSAILKERKNFKIVFAPFFLKIWRKWPNFLIKIFLRGEKWPFPPYFGGNGHFLGHQIGKVRKNPVFKNANWIAK